MMPTKLHTDEQSIYNKLVFFKHSLYNIANFLINRFMVKGAI